MKLSIGGLYVLNIKKVLFVLIQLLLSNLNRLKREQGRREKSQMIQQIDI
jgi:hypothetical protein